MPFLNNVKTWAAKLCPWYFLASPEEVSPHKLQTSSYVFLSTHISEETEKQHPASHVHLRLAPALAFPRKAFQYYSFIPVFHHVGLSSSRNMKVDRDMKQYIPEYTK